MKLKKDPQRSVVAAGLSQDLRSVTFSCGLFSVILCNFPGLDMVSSDQANSHMRPTYINFTCLLIFLHKLIRPGSARTEKPTGKKILANCRN